MKKKFFAFIFLVLFSSASAVSFESKFIQLKKTGEAAEKEMYTFKLDGVDMKAYKGSNESEMTWSEWLSIDAPGFNQIGLNLIKGSNSTLPDITTDKYFTISFIEKDPTTSNSKFLYAKNSADTIKEFLVKSGESVTLPAPPTKQGYTASWKELTLKEMTVNNVSLIFPEGSESGQKITWDMWCGSTYNTYQRSTGNGEIEKITINGNNVVLETFNADGTSKSKKNILDSNRIPVTKDSNPVANASYTVAS